MTYDRAFQVVVAEGSLYYGSSADDTVYCMDAATGEMQWSFVTEGPVRLAPAVANGKVYAGSDDGCLYCLEARTGGLLWKYRATAEDKRVSGNGHMISLWPIRCGVGVDNGTVYFAAGVFPTYGVYFCAVDAQTGKKVWQNKIDVEFFNSNGPLSGGKRSMQEGGIRVPMIARWPGKIKPGQLSDHPSAFWDFLPTACEVAGIDPPEDIDGISYLPELLGKTEAQKKHEYFYWIWAVRVGKWKLHPAGKDKYRLHDLENDIAEKHNLADKYPEVVTRCSKYFQIAKNPLSPKTSSKTSEVSPKTTDAAKSNDSESNSRLPKVRITELKPLKAATGYGALGIGKSAGGRPLSLSGKIYKNGIGIHANGHLVYARNPGWTDFVATVGLDDSQRSDPRASIVCLVIAEDAAGKKQVLAKSPTLKSGKQVQHNFDVPLPAGCVKIHLVVGDAGDGIHCDHANWVNAGFLGAARPRRQKTMEVTSPDGKIKATITFDETAGTLSYQVTSREKTILAESPLGISTDKAKFTSGLKLMETAGAKIDETYTLPHGKVSTYHNKANELALTLQKDGHKLNVIFRAYDDGVAFRYAIPGEGPIEITDEATAFHVAGKPAYWGQSHPNAYGYEFPLGKIDHTSYSLALLCELAESKHWVLLAQAATYSDYCIPYLKRVDGNRNLLKVTFPIDQKEPIKTSLPFASPWRVAVISADDLSTIVEQTMFENLNPPTEPELVDADWIVPGRSSWDWMAGDKANWKGWIDFDAEMGWEYHLIDDGWEGYIKDPKAATEYGREKGVGIFAWRRTPGLMEPEAIEKLFKQYAEIGFRGSKVDFFDRLPNGRTGADYEDTQMGLKVRDNLCRIGAKHKIQLVFHGCAIPSGEQRRWPHVVGTEAVHGQEGGPRPQSDNCIAYIRNPLGPVDWSPVGFGKSGKTDAYQLATSVVFQTGLLIMPGLHRKYLAHPSKEFLKKVPAAWDETKFIDGYPGTHTVIARRKGKDWYVGAITSEARAFRVLLDFLEKGKTYSATIYCDKLKGLEMTVETKEVASGDTLTIDAANRGGLVVHLGPRLRTASTSRPAEIAPPPNAPAAVEWNAATGKLSLKYHGGTIFEAAVTAQDADGKPLPDAAVKLEPADSRDAKDKVEQRLKFTLAEAKEGAELVLRGTVTGSAEAFPAETQGATRQGLPVIRTSVGLSRSLRNNAVYDRRWDWALVGPGNGMTRILPKQAGKKEICFDWNSRGPSLELTFRPRFYQKHKELPGFEPWTYEVWRDSVTGYCTWWPYRHGISQEVIGSLVDVFAEKHLPEFGYKYMQLDAGYEAGGGGGPRTFLDWQPKKFPEGAEGAIKKIRSGGMQPGIWVHRVYRSYVDKYLPKIGKEHPEWFVRKEDGKIYQGGYGIWTLNTGNKEAVDTMIRPIFQALKKQNWDYVKIDGAGDMMYSDKQKPAAAHFKKVGMTPEQSLRKWDTVAREELGRDIFILTCWGVGPGRVSVGLVDGVRLGGDGFQWRTMLGNSSMNGVAWRGDPDHCDILPERKGKRKTMKTFGAKAVPTDTIVRPAVVAMAGSMLLLSDKAKVYEDDANLEGVKRSAPVLFTVPGQLYDGGGNGTWWLQEIDRPFDHWSVLARFNWNGKGAPDQKVKFADLGLYDDRDYLVFEFWTQKYLGKHQGSFTAPAMDENNGMQVFAIREAREHPWVLSTTRHISQGGVSLLDEKWDAGSKTLSGKSKVVIGDPYVLTVYLPDGFRLESPGVSGEQAKIANWREIGTVRMVPSATKEVEWKMRFTK